MTSLALAHARFQLIETFRIPMALVGSAFFPAASMISFVVMTSNLFQYGSGVAEDRAQPWDPYARTLPVGAAPRFAGRVLAGLAMMGASLVPVVVIAAVAPYLPTGAAVRLMWSAVGDVPLQPASIAALLAWTAGFAGVAGWAYRRDEGRRFS